VDKTNKKSVICSLNIVKDLPYLSNLNEDLILNIEDNIIKVIYESFIVTADQDYFTARILAYNGLSRAFYWAASQSIEKYLKAFLLLNGKVDKKLDTHRTKDLLNNASSFDSSLNSIDVSPHPEIELVSKEWALSSFKELSLTDFINDLDTHGNPNNRYNAIGVHFNSYHIFALDKLTFFIREKVGLHPFEESFHFDMSNNVSTFKHNNPLFSSSFANRDSTSKLPLSFRDSKTLTHLEYMIKNSSHFSNEIRWLNEKIKLTLPKTQKNKSKGDNK
jgi:HEPN domain-containing protein